MDETNKEQQQAQPPRTRIVSLDPAVTDLLCYFGLAQDLVGITFRCDAKGLPDGLTKVTEFRGRPYADPVKEVINQHLSRDYVLVDRLKQLQPEIVISYMSDVDDDPEGLGHVRECLNEVIGVSVKLLAFNPINLTRVFEMFERMGRFLRVPDKGHSLAQRMKAQFMNWGDNFYERTKNKKVTFLSGIGPLQIGGRWIPDIIRYASALPQTIGAMLDNVEVSWEAILAFRPDVLIVAPVGMAIRESKRSFFELEKLPGWEDLPAVKRGEVFFTDGDLHFHRPTPELLESAAIIFSAVAGFDSGYICERDSMFRLRFLEMNRHKL